MSSPHPLDPLTSEEIQTAVSIVRAKSEENLHFNIVSLHEPRKAELAPWLAARSSSLKPGRMADVCVIAPGGKVADIIVDLGSGTILSWDWVEEVQPIVSSPIEPASPFATY